LANLGNIISNDCRRDPFGDHGGPFDRADGLCDRRAVLGISNVTGAGIRHTRGEPDAERLDSSANLLAGLLRPLVGSRSASISRLLLDEFLTLPCVLAAPPSRLLAITQSDKVSRFIVLVRDAMLYALRMRISDRPILSSEVRLIDYLRTMMAYNLNEQFRVLFLNARGMLIRDEVMGIGSICEAPVFPREVIRRALELGAAAIVLVHNHPSGDPEPSDSDLSITRRISICARTFDIALNDHIIVTKAGFTSFRSRGLL
jgi:DNA repair protein RadC